MRQSKVKTILLNHKASAIVFFLSILLAVFPAGHITAQAWQDIPLYGPGGEALFNYATMLARTIMFYDANRCGNNITGENRFNWRGDCHVNDGDSVNIDARGGYHDAGDHIKFGITNAYAASTLGWGFYEFRSEYEETGQDTWLLCAVKWATDYFIRCHPEQNTYLYSVGSDADHNYWGPPELQSDITSPRDIIICTPSNPASAAESILQTNRHTLNPCKKLLNRFRIYPDTAGMIWFNFTCRVRMLR